MLSDKFLQPDLVADLITEEKTAGDWTTTFAHIISVGIKMDATVWALKDQMRQEAKAIKTPRKDFLQGEAWQELRHITAILDSIKAETSRSGEAPDSWEYRLETIEDSIQAVAKRLELCMVEDYAYRQRVDENIDRINSRLVDVESNLGSSSVSEKVEPTVWENIRSLLQRDLYDDLKTTPTWTQLAQEIEKIKRSILDDRQSNVAFQDIIVRLSTEFKGDILHLDRIMKDLKLEITRVSHPSAQLFGTTQSPDQSDVEVLKQQQFDLEEKN